jgi:hypothetical protein
MGGCWIDRHAAACDQSVDIMAGINWSQLGDEPLEQPILADCGLSDSGRENR